MKKFWVLLGLFYFLSVVKLWAVNNGLLMSPPFVDMEINNGDKQKEVILELSNKSQGLLMINLSVIDFGSLDESGGIAFLTSKDNGDRKYALASWMSLEKDWVTIEAGKKETVKVTIINRDDLRSGGHYGAVLATVKTDEKLSKDMIGLNQALATLVYIQKTGGEKKNLNLKSIDHNGNWLQMPSIIKLRFENSGNVHLVPRGKIEIGDVSRGIINEASGKIFPESFRVFNVPVKLNRVWVWPGKYKIEVSYRYDGKAEFVTDSRELYYFGKEGLIILTILIIGAAVWKKWRE